MNTPTIGWIGLGNMGNPMVRNLVKAGYKVTIYNRTTAKAAALAQELGLSVAASPAALAAACDVIFTMVSDDNALQEIHTGKDGLQTGTHQQGLLLVDMSTVSPDITKKLATQLAAKNIGYLDAPVSGSVKPAAEGQLVIMVGGAEAHFSQARPILDHLGKAVLHLGPNGAGNYAKLSINLFLGIATQGLVESLLFATHNGIPADQFMTIVNSGALASPYTALKTPGLLHNDFKAAFALKHLAKDLRLAKHDGLNTPLGNAAHDTYQQALATGLGDLDLIAVKRYLAGNQ